jgi:hypothetical protein
MKKIFFTVTVFAVGMCALLCQCSTGPLAGGNSSQTGNAGICVESGAETISGTTKPGALVAIYELGFKPYMTPSGFCDSTVADAGGRFSFTPGSEGYFNLFVHDASLNNAGFISHIPVFSDTVFRDTIDTLRQEGYISGTATDTAGATYALSYIFINGSPFYTVTRNNGDFQLGPLPAGTYETGFFANFIVADVRTGLIAQMLSVVTDTTVITVVPDSVSTWHW